MCRLLRTRRVNAPLLFLALMIVSAGCGGEDTASPDAGRVTGTDGGAAIDATLPNDAATDAGGGGVDADVDGGPDTAGRWVPASPSHGWVFHIAGAFAIPNFGVAFEPSGDVVWGGAYRGETNLGPGPREANGEMDAFVSRRRRTDGGHDWVRFFGVGTIFMEQDTVRGVATDDLGNIYAVGTYSNGTNFGGGVRRAGERNDAVIVSYDSGGTYRWDRVFGAALPDAATDVVVRPNGDVCLVGITSGRVDFGGGVRSLLESGVVVCMSSDGEHRWDRAFENAYPAAIATDSENNLVVVGRFREAVELGGVMFTPAEGRDDMFILALDDLGADRWVKAFGAAEHDRALGVTTDANGNVYVVGAFNGTTTPVDFGGGPRSTAAGSAVIASYDGEGSYRWDRVIASGQFAGDVVADPSGHLIAGLSVTGTFDLGGGPRTGSIALAAYDPDGNYLWDRTPTISKPGSAEIAAIDLDPAGHIAVAGRFDGSIDFGAGLEEGSEIRAFVWYLDP